MKSRFLIVSVFLLVIVTISAQTQEFVQAQNLIPDVINVYPHDTQAYTQGLLWVDGDLFESTGDWEESSLREVDVTTGDVIRSVLINPEVETDDGTTIAADYFGEGLALVNGQFIQLTWQSGTAFIYEPDTFDRVGTYTYDGEGWGLCTDERYIYMSAGTPYLSIRQMDDFELVGQMLVTYNGQPINTGLLNELECVGDSVYANLYTTNLIVEINKFNGQIVSLIDASGLLTEAERAQLNSLQVLNGIAYNPDTETFFITGKDWPKMFEVNFVPQPVDE